MTVREQNDPGMTGLMAVIGAAGDREHEETMPEASRRVLDRTLLQLADQREEDFRNGLKLGVLLGVALGIAATTVVVVGSKWVFGWR